MAGEKTGKFYEQLVAFILQEAKSTTLFRSGTVEREQDIPGVSIRSDVVLRSSTGEIKAVFLVTHSRIEVHWAEKFKRDSAEFLELATSALDIGVICLVIFDARTLPALEAISASFFTNTVKISQIDTAGVCERYAHDSRILDESARLSGAEFADFIRKRSAKDPELASAVKKIVARFKAIIVRKNGGATASVNYISLTRSLLKDRRLLAPPRLSRATRFNRAISKLALFDAEELRAIERGGAIAGDNEWARQPAFWPTPDGKKGEMLQRIIGGKYKCVDPEIVGGEVGGIIAHGGIDSVFSSLSSAEILKIISVGGQDMMPRYRARIRGAAVVKDAVKFLADSHRAVVQPKKLKALFDHVAEDPSGALRELTGLDVGGHVDWHWLYTAIIALLKADSGRKQGFGYSKIAAGMLTPSFRRAVEHSILQNYEYRIRNVADGIISETVKVLAEKLGNLTPERIRSCIDASYRFLVWSEVEDKVIPHGVDVLPSMIRIAFDRAGLKLETGTVRSCLASALELPGTAGRTNVLFAGDNLVWYKAAHGSHVNDKTKEIQSLVSTWRQRWDSDVGDYEPVPSIHRFILVVDGDWRDEDLQKLQLYGWDDFYYPDELDKLVRAIAH